MTFKIKFNKSICKGCGHCTVCDNWDFNDKGEIEPKQIELDAVGCNQISADICPKGAITIIEE